MLNPKSLLVLLLCPFFFMKAKAQQPLPEVEKQLAEMAEDVLLHDSLSYKIEQNRQFARLLINTLERPESYYYPWDSLPTVSVLRAEDDAFRIFTWHIVDKNYREYRGEQYHYYFGLVQREVIQEDGTKDYIVIPLLDRAPISAGVENQRLDNQHWLGALYYPLRGHGHTIPSYTTKSRTVTAVGDSVYVLGEGWVTGESRKVRKTTYYLLLGWNGGDNQVNYKMAEALYFDPNDVNKVYFGAGIFYFDQHTPRLRALFRYQENAPFSLNMGFVKGGGLFGNGSDEMIIYDHMGIPNFKEGDPVSIFQAGPDGSYDGFKFEKRLGGFRWYQNVELSDRIDRDRASEIAANQEEIIRARLDQLRYWAELMEDESLVRRIEKIQSKERLSSRTVRQLRQQEAALLDRLESKSQAERDRLREAGIQP